MATDKAGCSYLAEYYKSLFSTALKQSGRAGARLHKKSMV